MKESKTYTKKQIKEALAFWEKRLNEIEDQPIVEVVSEREKIEPLLPEIVDLVIKTYMPIGGYYGATDIKKLKATTKLVKLVRNSDHRVAACSFYRDIEGSAKLQAYANDGSAFGKAGVKAIIKSDVAPYTDWVWGEVSGKVEVYYKKFGGFPLPNEYVAEVLDKPANKIILMPDGFHYKRIIGNNESDTEKVIFGFRNIEIANKVTSEVNYELRRTEFNTSTIGEDESEENLKKASSFVNQLSDLYDEEDLVQLTPGLFGELSSSLEELKKHEDEADWVKRTEELAEYLKSKISVVSFFKSNL